MDYLNRHASGFDEKLWAQIDHAAVNAAREVLTVRRFLPVEGPYGVGLTAIESGDDRDCRIAGDGEADAVLSRAISVPMLRKSFCLSIRRVEGVRMGQPLPLTAVVDAAQSIARREEEFIYLGRREFGIEGLLSAEGKHHFKGGHWGSTEQALNDVLAAINLLDGAGFRGPYALALSPPLYNALFRRYEGTDMLQLEHLRRVCERGVYKAAIAGAVVVDPRVGRLIIGQDLMTGYARQDGIRHELYLSESLVLVVENAKAVCTLEVGAS